MDVNKVDQFVLMNGKYFEPYVVNEIRERLLNLDDSKWAMINSISFNDPTISLVVSLFGGYLGIDRFLIGDIGLGVGKLLTGGGCGIWAIIDWFLIMDATRKKNYEKLMPYLF
ncbi:MAG: TM2 domain-containing protein [Bacteroides sp.]|nr:TM2 domain-containing protein [Bacteroides sp.]